jgi:DNA-binding winged helix-turn-helix (wHTH) protein
MRAIGLRMKMDMRRSVRRPASRCLEARVNGRPSFPEEILKGGSINGLRTAASVQPVEGRALAFGPAGSGQSPFTFDRTSRLLWKEGVEVPLPPRVLGVLALLLERPGELVSKPDLIGAVWRDSFVTETSLAEAISVLRQTLGDDPQRPTYIQTLHRRGYRLIADVQDHAPRVAAPEAIAAARSAAVVEPEPRLSLLVPWVITLFALLIAAVAVWQYLDTAAPPSPRPVRFTIALPLGLTVAPTGAPVAVSSDGSLLALAACRGGGSECGIYLRPFSQVETTLVAGTANGAAPFFSHDGRSLGYFANGRLHTIALGGGSPTIVADAAEPLGATWLRDGEIVFARAAAEGLFVAAPNGGAVRPLTTPAHGGHRWPSALPDGSGVLFTVGDERYAAVVSMRTRAWGRLLDGVTAAHVPLPGYLLAQRGSDLVASAFDDRTRSIAGLPVAVASGLSPENVPQFAMNAAGTLAIAPPGASAVQVVLGWTGELRRLVPAPEPSLPR